VQKEGLLIRDLCESASWINHAGGVEALEEALAKYGKPEIFNTDQGSHFTHSTC
jgi:hypothetical protein